MACKNLVYFFKREKEIEKRTKKASKKYMKLLKTYPN